MRNVDLDLKDMQRAVQAVLEVSREDGFHTKALARKIAEAIKDSGFVRPPLHGFAEDHAEDDPPLGVPRSVTIDEPGNGLFTTYVLPVIHDGLGFDMPDADPDFKYLWVKKERTPLAG